MTFYHLNSTDLWNTKISHQGLRPYKIKNRQTLSECERCGYKLKTGVWLWPKYTEKLLSDFYLWQRAEKGLKDCILLEVVVDNTHLLTKAISALHSGRKAHLFHDLVINRNYAPNYNSHEREPFDIYLKKIPAAYLRPIARIREEIDWIDIK